MAKNGNLREVPLNQIRPSEVALRSVNKDKEEYFELVQSIKEKGVLLPVLVQEIKDKETGKTVFGLIDGLHRYTGAIDAGLESLPVHVVTADEAERLEMQIIANLHVIETRPGEYSEQLKKLIALHPTMTVLEQANKLGKSVTWLNDRLSLVKLTDEIKQLVNDGKINITNACNLAKLPSEEQPNFVERAITMPPNEFIPTLAKRVKEIKDAKRQGREVEGPKPFEPAVYLQKLGDVKAELSEPNIGRGLINQFTLTNPIEVWNMAISWVLHLDPNSIDLAKAADEKRKKDREEANAKKKAEREEKKRQEAQLLEASVTSE